MYSLTDNKFFDEVAVEVSEEFYAEITRAHSAFVDIQEKLADLYVKGLKS
jgi:hypothetical protein